ncbi:hypothetical protein CgunFtcFv8_003351 [Champsocephalus gunnari]|uniref:Uncharacterized protein n=1 Tax=Champsocephalus gunnari TaxID=52237 RepID=A0AAN8DAP7_CHAGU|nr:hypothetical protein CgunFtcFv8_003351 [Champsocephalus gunnari]
MPLVFQLCHLQTGHTPSGVGTLLHVVSVPLPFYSSIHPSLSHFPVCIQLAVTQYVPTAHSPPSLTKEQEGCIELNALPQWDPIHQLQHYTETPLGSTHQAGGSLEARGSRRAGFRLYS